MPQLSIFFEENKGKRNTFLYCNQNERIDVKNKCQVVYYIQWAFKYSQASSGWMQLILYFLIYFLSHLSSMKSLTEYVIVNKKCLVNTAHPELPDGTLLCSSHSCYVLCCCVTSIICMTPLCLWTSPRCDCQFSTPFITRPFCMWISGYMWIFSYLEFCHLIWAQHKFNWSFSRAGIFFMRMFQSTF